MPCYSNVSEEKLGIYAEVVREKNKKTIDRCPKVFYTRVNSKI